MPADNHLRYSDNYLREGCREPTHSPSATMTDDARQTVEALDPGLKPFLKPRSSPSFRQKQDSETKLAENDRIDGDFSFVSSQPFNDFRLRCRSQRIRGFRFNRDKKSFFRTRQQPINKALVRSRFTTYQPVFTTIDPFYFELLTRRDLVLLAWFRWQDDLSF